MTIYGAINTLKEMYKHIMVVSDYKPSMDGQAVWMAIKTLERQMSINEPKLEEDGTLFIDLDIPTEKVKRICLGNPNTNIGGLYYLDDEEAEE